MINADMRCYDYFTFGNSNGYGQPTLSNDVKGCLTMAIYTSSQSTTDNIRFKDATYIGLTHAPINDKYVIQYGAEKLKVLYIEPKGRYTQVWLKNI